MNQAIVETIRDLRGSQIRALILIDYHNGLSEKKITALSGHSPSVMKKALQELQEMNYVAVTGNEYNISCESVDDLEIPDEEPEEKKGRPPEWCVTYAKGWWQVMKTHNWITKTEKENQEETIRRWAGDFHRIHKRGFEKNEVKQVLSWLTRDNDFWIPNGAIRSPRKFLEKKDGVLRFEVFLKKSENLKPQMPEEGERVTEDELDALKKHYGESIAQEFSVVSFTKRDEPIYER